MRKKIAKPKKYRQNRDVTKHYHPRWLARAVVHNRLEKMGASGVNQKAPGTTQSMFAQHWRDEADVISAK